MKRLLQLITFGIFLASCTHDLAPSNLADLSTDVLVTNQQGGNLLSASTANAYRFENIRFYSIENGVRSELINIF